MDGERVNNRILRNLATAEAEVFRDLSNELEPFPLQRGAELSAAKGLAGHVFFVESGVISMVATTENGNSVEVALVGPEGVAGIADALGDRVLPYSLVVQLPGLAYRAPKDLIRHHIYSCNAFHDLLMNYSQRVMHQLALSALCNRFHSSEQRLARWLLLTADRAGTNRLELTHEFVSQMVGAPRSAVSAAASSLRDKKIIDYRRGVLTIRDHRRLHKIACECFDAFTALHANGHPSPLVPRGTALK